MNEALKRLVLDRAENTCEYCRLPQWLDVLPFQIDHVIAEQHHGPTAAENLALSCLNDNLHKGPNIAGLDPDTGLLTRLFHPRQDNWEEHFGWGRKGDATRCRLTGCGRLGKIAKCPAEPAMPLVVWSIMCSIAPWRG